MGKAKHNEIWGDCLEIIKNNIPSSDYDTWFSPLVPHKFSDNTITVVVPSQFFIEYIEDKFISLLAATLQRVIGENAKLEYKINLPNNQPKVTQNYPSDIANVEVAKTVITTKVKNPFDSVPELEVKSNLNKNLHFGTLIQGECNKLGIMAGHTVAKNPGTSSFNPFILFSGSGLGKTHLAQAIGLETLEDHPEKSVLYVTANLFQTQYQEAVRSNHVTDFINFYQMIDVLIIDDMQELAGKKEKTQSTFFHIFNHLQQLNKQIISTFDRPPSELQGIEARLLSRFKWGLICELTKPDYDTRLAILRQKLVADGVAVEDEILEYIAKNVTTNIRELEGVLVSLMARSTLENAEITIDLAKNIIEKIVTKKKQDITIASIRKSLCEYYHHEEDVFELKTRKREVVQIRQMAMFFARKYTKESLSTIGSMIGNKDHATVLHSCKTIDNIQSTDKNFRKELEAVQYTIENPSF